MQQSGQAVRHGLRKRFGFAVAVLAAVLVAALNGATTSRAVSGPTWWKVDLHEHSAFSGDARADIGVDAAKAKLQNYNAVFLTDHDRGSGFQISGDNGNKISVPEQLNNNWTSKLLPSSLPSGSSGILPTAVQSPVHSGTYSLHMSTTASTSTTVRSMTYNPRGMGLRSGAIMLDFWAYPVSTGATAGLDVSVSLGGDTTVGPTPFGYTTSDGVTHIGKTTAIVWQMGGARAAATGGTSDVFANALSFTPNTWNHYVINITTGQVQWTPQGGSTTTSSSTGLNQLPALDAPADYDVLTYVKMEAAARNGTADGYFDDFNMNVASPTCTSTEFVYRNSLLPALAGTNFVIFPAREMGQNNHANQFNFGITSTSQYKDTFTDSTQDDNAICAGVNNPSAQWQFSRLGTDNIAGVQASGYPVQDNHPGVTDGVSDVVSTNAHGADAIEARTGADYSNPSDIPTGDAWDQILMKNVVIMGTQGSDAHEGVSTTTPSMYIDAPSLTLNDLMHSFFEGRAYGAPGNFGGTVVFNLDGSAKPYPARYPVYVPSSQSSANVNLNISGGIGASQQVRWIYSNAGATPSVTPLDVGSSYSAQRTIPLSGAFTYVRAAVITPGASVPTVVNTEPIFFRSVNGMQAGMSARVDSITPPSGTCSCTIAMTKGITSATYSNSTLSLALNDPVGSGVQMLVQSPLTPLTVRVDGSAVSAAATLSAYQAGTGTSWFYDSGSSMLYVRDLHASASSTVAVDYSGGGDVTPPSVPTGVNGAPVGSSEVDLSWSASTDNVGGSGVAGYNVYRDGSKVNVGLVSSTNYADTGLSPSTQYGYTVSAVDNQGNESARSSPVKQVTTGSGGGGGGGGTFGPIADSYVDGNSPSTNFGSNVKLRVDASPTVNSYLRFDVSGVSGSVTGVTLKVFATSNLSAGFEVHALSDDSWGESTITSANAPAAGALLQTSGAATANGYVTVMLPASAVSGNGHVDFVLVGRSTTALALASRESANPPQLVVTSSGGGGGDVTPPSVPTGVNGAPVGSSEVDLSWSASTDNVGGSGVAGYNVYRDGSKVNVGLVSSTNYADTGLSPSTQYGYTVSAVDNQGNESARSSPVKQVTTGSGGGGDVTPPSVPTGVNGAPVGSSEVDLSWSASTDNVGGSGVAGYNVYRDGSKVNVGLVSSTNYADTGLSPSTQYGYTVSAVDNQGNESARSSPVKQVTTGSGGGGGGGGTFGPIADSYVDGNSPSTNFGSNVKLRVDASPTVNSYLRFDVSGVSGSVTGVTLKVFATSNLSAGFEVHALSDDSWGESTITSANAPAAGALLQTSGAATANGYVTVMLPASAVSGNGHVDFVLVGRSTTALALASRESANPPQLVVTSSGGGGGDVTPPSVPTGVNGAPVGSSEVDLSWSASTDNVGGSGVAGYNVYRDGSKVNVGLVSSTNYADTGLSPSTQYGYTVSAVDNQGNESARSSPVKQVTTGSGGGGGGGGTFGPIADSYVDGNSPSTNFGSNVKLRVDASPTVNSYLRFDVSGVSGSVTGVTLKVFATSNLSAGFEVHALSDDSWGESTITSANAPAAGALLQTSGAATANGYVTVMLPASAVSGNGHVDFVLVGRSTTALALASRESANPPQLVVTTS